MLVCPELARKAKRPKKQALRRSRPEAGGSVLHPLLPGPAGLQFRGLVYYHHGGKHGSVQADMVLEKEPRVLQLDP